MLTESISTLRRLLDYDPGTGIIKRKPRPLKSFKAGPRQRNACAAWNSRFAGKAITLIDANGYLKVRVAGKVFLGHRVAFALHYGRWPEANVDHDDGDPGNNRIENLRDASQSQNMKNRKRPRNNKSGVVGVQWLRRERKWQARIWADNVELSLGQFSEFEDAVRARKDAEKLHGYHPNHGR